MLRKLDPRKLKALASNDDDDEADSGRIYAAKEWLKEPGYMDEGVVGLLEAFPFAPRLRNVKRRHYEDVTPTEEWSIAFRNSPFESLHLQSDSEGVVDIYGSDARIKSFKIFGCPQSWQAMVKWLWAWGNERQTAKVLPQAPKPHAKIRGHSRRTEKPLLRQVLRKAGFKTESGKASTLQELTAIPKEAVITMEDVDVEKSNFS